MLLLLIQIGGLGIMTAGTLFLIASGGRLSLADEHLIRNAVGGLRSATPVAVFAHSLAFVLVIELGGAGVLFALAHQAGDPGSIATQLWQAVFHAVSAFCNAGFSIYPEGLVRWAGKPWRLATIGTLVVLGGIGLLTLVNLRFYYFWRRDRRARGYLTLQTRLSVAVTLVLLVGGALFMLVSEWDHAFAGMSFPARAGQALFHSAMTRTAGFNAIDNGAMQPSSLLGTMVLMFIGGSPGSMAGGIKTTTFALLVLAAYSALRRRSAITIWGRSIPEKQAFTAIMFTLLAAAFLFAIIIALMATEHGLPSSETPNHWLGLMYEAVSAFGTVGLSTGVTSLLSIAGKLVICAAMFGGRVGPLVIALFLVRPPRRSGVRYPPETLSLG